MMGTGNEEVIINKFKTNTDSLKFNRFGDGYVSFHKYPAKPRLSRYLSCGLNMAKYIIPAVVGSFAISYVCDQLIADKKIFGSITPSTVLNKELWEETDKKFQAWPRTAGPPVVMNPISRQNFIVKSRES